MKRTWPQRLFIGFNAVFVVGLLATAGSLAYVYSKYSQLPRIELGSVLSVEHESTGGARNVLVVGVDSAAGLDPDDPIRSQRDDAGIGGLRSDTIMILHLDPDEKQASLLSLPRDLWLPVAGNRGNQRINTAVGEGGAQLLVATVQEYFGIPIHNYVQIDFAGFQDLVEALDGVPVYFDTPVRDTKSGLSVPEAGCITLSPEQSLAYSRSRAFQYFDDGRWRTDPTGDLGRISRQQDFMRRALRRAVARGVRNPVTLDALIDAGLDSVIVDDSFTAQQVVDLGNRFRSFNPENLVMYSLPVQEGYAGGAAIVRLIEDDAQPILEIFRDGESNDIASSTSSSSTSSSTSSTLDDPDGSTDTSTTTSAIVGQVPEQPAGVSC